MWPPVRSLKISARRSRRRTCFMLRRLSRPPRLDLRNGHLSAVNLHQIHVRRALPAFLALRTVLFEFDRAIETENIHLPQRSANGLRLSLAGDPDRLRDRADAVIAAKT